MKKLFPVLVVLMFFVGACGASGAAGPTPIPINTAIPTAEVAQNEAMDSSNAEAGEERVSPVDGMAQVFIPDGSFRMGGMDSNTDPDELPSHAVTMSAFWMDKLESPMACI